MGKVLMNPSTNLMPGLTEEQIEMYHIFIPQIRVFNFRKDWYHFPEDDKKNKSKYSFSINIGDRFIIWGLGLEIKDFNKDDFSWWSGNADGRILTGIDDMIICNATAGCIRQNIGEIKISINRCDCVASWSYPTKELIEELRKDWVEEKEYKANNWPWNKEVKNRERK